MYWPNHWTGLPEWWFFFVYSRILGYFLANYAPKILNYANWTILHNILMFQFIELANLLWFYKIIYFQSKNMHKKVVLLHHKSKHGTLFFSKLWLVIFLPIMAHVWQKPEHGSQGPAAESTRNALLICDILECFLQQSGGYLLWKCTIFMVRKFPWISQGMEKQKLLINKVVKILEN